MGYAARVARRVVRERDGTRYGPDGEAGGPGDEAGGPGDDAGGPDAPPDVDAIEELGDEIAVWAAHVSSGKHHLLTLIARFHALGGWELGGHRDCAAWLSFRTGMSPVTAREYVRVALALDDLPETSGAMRRGKLSFCKVRALTRVARPETESDLLELAEGATTKQLEILVRTWKRHSRLEEAELERQRLKARRLSMYPGDFGMYEFRALLPAEGGALAMRAIDEACDELYRAERASGEHGPDEEDTQAAAARRRADALVLLVERALAVGFEGRRAAEEENADDGRARHGSAEATDSAGGGSTDADSVQTAATAGARPGAAVFPRAVSGTRARRYQVMLHVEPSTFAEDGEPGRSELEDGTRVSYETARRIACDAGIVRVEHSADGEILDVGRRTRSFPASLRRALEIRDRGCRFPGCGLRFTEGHHVVHWTRGGETKLTNSVLLCRHHHRLVHEGGWRLDWWPHGRVAFTDPRGRVHVGGEVPKVPELPEEQDPAAALVRGNRGRGAPAPDAWTASARWKRERDIPDAVLFRAGEAGMG